MLDRCSARVKARTAPIDVRAIAEAETVRRENAFSNGLGPTRRCPPRGRTDLAEDIVASVEVDPLDAALAKAAGEARRTGGTRGSVVLPIAH
jgi:hypothetical protein